MFKPMKLADVRAHTQCDPMSYSMACEYATANDPFLYNMACALSLHTWNNTIEDWRRLEGALVILAHKRRAARKSN